MNKTEAFIQKYIDTGDYLVSMKDAGFRKGNDKLLVEEGKKLREKHRAEIEVGFQKRLRDGGSKALSVIEALMHSSNSDTVKLNAAKEILDRGGYKAWSEEEGNRNYEEVQAKLVQLVGKDGAKMLVGAIKVTRGSSGPEIESKEL
tara:strand:+ start:784 stop:1221 length:438 start_codon:yes stop_codon:yes gene_type:complete